MIRSIQIQAVHQSCEHISTGVNGKGRAVMSISENSAPPQTFLDIAEAYGVSAEIRVSPETDKKILVLKGHACTDKTIDDLVALHLKRRKKHVD